MSYTELSDFGQHHSSATKAGGLNIQADAGATVPALPSIAAGLVAGGGVLLVAGTVLLVTPLRRAGQAPVTTPHDARALA